MAANLALTIENRTNPGIVIMDRDSPYPIGWERIEIVELKGRFCGAFRQFYPLGCEVPIVGAQHVVAHFREHIVGHVGVV